MCESQRTRWLEINLPLRGMGVSKGGRGERDGGGGYAAIEGWWGGVNVGKWKPRRTKATTKPDEINTIA